MINCRLDGSCIDDPYDDYNEEDEDEEEEEETGNSFVAENELLNLLVQLRGQFIQGDYRSLYAVWEKYGYLVEDDDEDHEENEDEYEGESIVAPPIPPERSLGKKIIEQFSNMLE